MAHDHQPCNEGSRTTKELVSTLVDPPMVTSEKNVWAFWDSGWETMPPWMQRNVLGWIQKLAPQWTVRVLDRVEGSRSNILRFVSPTLFPECFIDGTLSGRFAATQASDMARLACVYEHGGVYMDVGIILFAHLDDACWTALENPSSEFEVALPLADMSDTIGLCGSFFLAARKRNGLIRRWHEIYLRAWHDRKQCLGIHSHPLFAHLIKDGNIFRKLKAESTDALDYFSHTLAWERLRLLQDPSDGFSGMEYCMNRVFLLDWREFAMLFSNDGPKQFRLLQQQHSPAQNTADYDDAKDFCYYSVSHTIGMKLYHWNGNDTSSLADFWDRPENEDADHAVGTFAAQLRHASVKGRQARNVFCVQFPAIMEKTWCMGVLQPAIESQDNL